MTHMMPVIRTGPPPSYEWSPAAWVLPASRFDRSLPAPAAVKRAFADRRVRAVVHEYNSSVGVIERTYEIVLKLWARWESGFITSRKYLILIVFAFVVFFA